MNKHDILFWGEITIQFHIVNEMTQQQHDVHSRERERYNNMSEHILPNISMEHDISKCHLNTTLKYLRRHRRRHSIILHIILSLSLSLSRPNSYCYGLRAAATSLSICVAPSYFRRTLPAIHPHPNTTQYGVGGVDEWQWWWWHYRVGAAVGG